MSANNAIPYQLWDSILRPVEAIFGEGNAVIVGGAVRDALLDRPSKDIDVFVPTPDYDHLLFRLNMGLPQDKFALTRTWDPDYAHWFKGSDKTLLGVTTWKVAGVDADVQIMGVAYAPPTEDIDFPFANWTVNRADFGLCRVGYLAGGVTVYGTGFNDDFHNKRLTLLRADTEDQHAASMRRLRRLAKKLPEFTYVDGRPAEQQGIVSTLP